jgi:hypothetical protein
MYTRTAAVRRNGTVVVWGPGFTEAERMPPGLTGVTAIAVGVGHVVALVTAPATAPRFTLEPASQTVAGWQSATLTASTVAVPPPLLAWQRSTNDGAAWQNLVEGVEARGVNTETLKVAGKAAAGSGQLYRLSASNIVGVTTSSAALLTITETAAGTVVAWGGNGLDGYTVPPGLADVVAITTGESHTVALKADGTVVAWGDNSRHQLKVPPGLSGVVAIAAGSAHTMALRSNGTVVVWGLSETSISYNLGAVTAIAAAGDYNLALMDNGKAFAWGGGSLGQTEVPADLDGVIAIAAGKSHALALKRDGTVVQWGDPFMLRLKPAGLAGIVAIAAGDRHALGLRHDGTVVAWGSELFWGEVSTFARLSDVKAIAAGTQLSVALRRDGTLTSVGSPFFNFGFVPDELNRLTAIAAGGAHFVALINPPVAPGFASHPSAATVPAWRWTTSRVH